MTSPRSIVRIALRAVAVAIAVAGVADPAATVTRPVPTVVAVVAATSPANQAAADASVAALERSGGSGLRFERRPGGPGLPCDPDEACVIVSDGSVSLRAAPDRRVPAFLVRVGVATSPHVAVLRAETPAHQHPEAVGLVRVDLSGTGVTGRKTEVRVLDGDIAVGTLTHEWTQDGVAHLTIPWWPVADGPRVLRVEAATPGSDAAAADAAVDLGVTVSATRFSVLVYEPRPSWTGTFIRRALEGDPRFSVAAHARLGPALSSGTAGSDLDVPSLDAADAVIVGSPEALTESEVDLLDRYVRTRGGLLVIAPDRAPSGPAARWFAGWTEHLTPDAQQMGPLRASEVLRAGLLGPLDRVLVQAPGGPVIVLAPTGAGRLVRSGAMDAWRHRAEGDGAFERFWRSVVVDGASKSAALSIEMGESVAEEGADIPVVVRWRAMEPAASLTVRATGRCGDGSAEPLRLWPSGAQGMFTGTWHISGAAACLIDASVEGGPSATAGLSATPAPRRSAAVVLEELARLTARTGGIAVAGGEEATLAARLGTGSPAVLARVPVWPMRSPWWMLVFAACLGGEWWLRRRNGLR